MRKPSKLLREALPEIIGGLVVLAVQAVIGELRGGVSIWNLVFVVVACLWLGCVYIVRKKTPPLVEGGKGQPAFPRWRRLALRGFVAIPLLTAVALGSWWYTETHRLDQVVVLVADFYQEGTKEDPYGLSGVILGRLRDALAEERMASVRALQQPVTAQQGGDRAREIGRQHLYMLTLGDRAIGQKRQTAIVIWGWYAVTEEKAWVDAHFEVVRPPGGLPEIHLDGQVAALTELEHFDFQVSLSRDMAYLTTFTVGLVHFGGETYEEAIATFSKAIKLRPDLAEPYNNRGAACAHRGEYNLALADYGRAIELKPDYAMAYYNRGVIYAHKGEYDQAIADYGEAIKLKPDYAKAYNNRGIIYAYKGEYDQAIVDYGEAIKLGYAEAYNNRGNAYRNKGEYDLAIADYDNAIELRPDLAEAYYNRGNTYLNKGKFDLAITDYDKAIELKLDWPQVYNNRGNAYRNKGEYDLAIADYNRALELKLDYAKAYYNRGLAHKITDEKEKAIKDFERFLELSEDEYWRKEAEGQLRELRGQ